MTTRAQPPEICKAHGSNMCFLYPQTFALNHLSAEDQEIYTALCHAADVFIRRLLREEYQKQHGKELP